jgi:hypothetical protein
MPRERHPNESPEEREFRLMYGKSPTGAELIQFRKHRPRIKFDEIEKPPHLQEDEADSRNPVFDDA